MGYSDARLAKLASENCGKRSGLDYFKVQTPAERAAIFRLRYNAYYSQGLIRKTSEASLSDWQDDEDGSSIYGITLEGTLVSTIRLCVMSKEHKACATYMMYKDYLNPLIEGGLRIVDGSRLAVSCTNSAARRRVVMYALSLTVNYATRVRASLGTIIARHSHVPFYERNGFYLVDGPFEYEEALTPLSLMMIRLPAPNRESRAPASQIVRRRFSPTMLHEMRS